jgi:hypothetical protein
MRLRDIHGADFEVAPEEFKKVAMALGWRPSEKSEYLKRAKENISNIIDDMHAIETEEDAKAILAHCLKLSNKQADLMYEVMEFAIGMAN